MLARRPMLVGFVTASVVGAARAAQGDSKVMFIGGADCPFCQEWRKTRRDGWLASPEYKQVTYIEIESPNLKDAYRDQYWKPELRPLRDLLPQKSGTPRFAMVKNGKLVVNYVGHWDQVYKEVKVELQRG